MRPDPRLFYVSTPGSTDSMKHLFEPPKNEFFETTELRAPGRKTSVWELTARNGGRLGDVRYWPAWRKFVFFPEAHTLFDFKCLTTIAEFCNTATTAHRESLKVKP